MLEMCMQHMLVMCTAPGVAAQYDPADMAFDVEEVAVPSLAAAVKAVKGARGDEADALTDALEAERKGALVGCSTCARASSWCIHTGKRGAVEALGDDAADGAEAATYVQWSMRVHVWCL